MNFTLETLFIVGLSLANGLFVMSEIAIVSARKTRLQQRADEGNESAKVALDLANSPNQFLSTVQIFITLIGTLAAAVGGATVHESLRPMIATVPVMAPYAGVISLSIVVLGVTIIQLVLGELLPKQIALAYPEAIAGGIAPMMRALSIAMYPAVWLLTRSSETLLWILHIRPPAESPVTEEEIKIMLEQGTQAGVFEEAEQDIVERVLRLGDRRISSLMTPRTDIIWIDSDDPIGDSMRTMINGGHTYYPVCRGSIDQLLGMVSVKFQWARMVNRQPPDISAGLIEPLFVPETMSVLKTLETFKKSKRHVAAVIDEYGSICGLVTLNDVLEAMVGDIPQSSDPQDQSAVQRPDGSWLFDGLLSIDELRQLLSLDELPDQDQYQTVAGFVMHQLGRIPRVADRFAWKDHQFEIVDMDGHRIDRVLVTPPAPQAADGESGESKT